MHTAESGMHISELFWNILLSWLSGVMHTVKSDSAIWRTQQNLTPRYDAHGGVWLHGMMHTAELDSAVWYLGEIETKLENTLACLSVAQMGSFHEKMEFEACLVNFLILNEKYSAGRSWQFL